MEAVKFYLQSQGLRATQKQIDKLLKYSTIESIERMAIERGFKK